jgi:hypothetical protein
MKEKIIPIKYGSHFNNEPAFANLETGQVQTVDSWNDSPSNTFIKTSRVVSSPSDLFSRNYFKIFNHE